MKFYLPDFTLNSSLTSLSRSVNFAKIMKFYLESFSSHLRWHAGLDQKQDKLHSRFKGNAKFASLLQFGITRWIYPTYNCSTSATTTSML